MSKNLEKRYVKLMKVASQKLAKLQAELDALKSAKEEPLAIVGMGCRFPGGAATVGSPDSFWQLLRDGVDAISEVPKERWNLDVYYDANPETPGKMSTRYGGFINQLHEFDAKFFGLSPREAVSIDPQQRLLLEVSWEALEHAGLAPDHLMGSRSGVFIGIWGDDYNQRLVKREPTKIDAYLATGTAHSVAAGRLSYFYGLQGPSLAVDTACSSSLVSVHLACQSLRHKECDLALAGGVNLLLSPEFSINFSKARMLAPDGRCKTFDARANGYVRAEGCGVIVLKRMQDAIANGDRILALIRGSAINQDGRSQSLTAPNGPQQIAVIRQALQNAGVTQDQVSYIEAHGTGTALGDPIEVGALGAVFSDNIQPLLIGSVKTNIGHLEAAAGIAGLIKVVLSLRHGEIPPHLHFKTPSPYISWHDLPVKVPTERTPWLGEKRIAGVSSFGFSGTNAHVVLEEAPAANMVSKEVRPWHLLTLSAKTEAALEQLKRAYVEHLEAHPDGNLASLCFTANTGRSHFQHRQIVVAQSQAQMRDKLLSVGQTNIWDGSRQPEIAFLFTGQGSQYVGMGQELYETEPTFRQTIEQCDEILESYLGESLINLLYGDEERINQTAYTQPALFALEYALAELWQSWGVVPSVVMGHSVGELVAACVAGVFSLEDGLKLVAERGRLMQSTQKGEMVALFTSEERVKAAIGEHDKWGQLLSTACPLGIAAINGPQLTVISGTPVACQEIVSYFERDGVRCQPLTVSHAFHSPLMEPILEPFRQVARQMTFSAPKIALISNLTGEVVSQEVTKPEYWVRHIRQPVRFADSMNGLQQMGVDTFVEIGPKPTLLGMGRRCLSLSSPPQHPKGMINWGGTTWLPSLRPDAESSTLLATLAQLYVQGVEIDWAGFYRGERHDYKKVVLPTYPFQRERYWFEPSPRSPSRAVPSIHPLVHTRIPTPKQVIFESKLSATNPAYLADHRVPSFVRTSFETPILPASAYLEMVLAAAARLYGTHQLEISDVSWTQALILEKAEGQAKTVQLILTPHEEGYTFEIFSLTQDSGAHESEWIAHASGKVRRHPSTAHSVDLSSLKARYAEEVPIKEYYQDISQRGIHYGPSFQAIEQLFLSPAPSQTGVLGRVSVPETLSTQGYHLHPVLLDACFQLSFAIHQEHAAIEPEEQLYLPFALTALQLYAPPKSTLQRALWVWVAAKGQRAEGALTVELELFNEDGTKVADVIGLTLRRGTLSAQRPAKWESWLYQLLWQAAPGAPTRPLPEGGGGCWLIFAEEGGIGEQVAQKLTERGARCVLAFASASYQQVTTERYELNPKAKDEFERLISAITSSRSSVRRPIAGIVHLWSLDQEEEESERACASVLHLVQALSQIAKPPRLWLVTQGAQAVSNESALDVRTTSTPISLWQAPLWGLGRVISQEHPKLSCVCVDLAPEGAAEQIEALFDELWLQDSEDQVAFRHGERYVARLTRFHDFERMSHKGEHKNQAVQLRLSKYGTLDNLHLACTWRQAPTAGEVEIEIRAAALNFRDVLNALGMLKEYYPQHLGIHQASDCRFGFECAGVISRVGKDVEGFNVGDEVIASLVSGALASHAISQAELVVPKPPELSFEEAATLPLAFLTAAYGLEHLAQIRAGERVLIHSAAGGVGQAAVQIAQAVGAEIFATASPGKWDVLKAQGIKHIYNSRTYGFADQVLLETNGQGVHIVLNSLSGEFIPKSLQVLAQGGRFVEIGKLGVWDKETVHSVRPDVAYFLFDLGEVADDNPHLISQLFTQLADDISDGRLTSLPHKVFALDDVVDAFRYMQRAKHIGKIVIQIPPVKGRGGERARGREGEGPIDEHGSYLITGGLGALGRQMAHFLVGQGARHLLLTGRGGAASPEAQEAVRQLEEKGALVTVVKADVSKPEDVARLLSQVEPPLRGVIHAAGVLDDGILTSQSWPRFLKVMAPKVQGAWNLHQQTQDMPLDFFVLFSSAASLLGRAGAGQANYAAANAFMDGLAHYRHALGLPALSINWGPWFDYGMASNEQVKHRLTREGWTPITPQQGEQILEMLLKTDAAQVGVLPLDWKRFPSTNGTSLIQALLPKPSESETSLLEQIESAVNPHAMLQAHIRAQIGQVLLMNPEQIEPRQRLFDLGLDSLMAVELRNRLEKSFKRSFRSTLLFDFPTLEALEDYLSLKLELKVPTDTAQTLDAPDVSEVAALSEAEAEALLLQELGIIN